MATRIFLDTNIILDVFDNQRPYHVSSKKLLERIENERLLAYSSESVLTTVDYILKKFLPTVTVRQILSEILQMVTILPCTNLIFLRALHSNLNDLEDAVLYQIALENNIQYFVTNDQEFIKKSSNGPIDVFGAEKLFEVL